MPFPTPFNLLSPKVRLCSYCGRENPDEAIHCRECGTSLSETPEASHFVPPSQPKFVPDNTPSKYITPEIFSDFLEFDETFHHVQWPRAYSWIRNHIPTEDQWLALNESVRAWARQLRNDLGGSYCVALSRYAIIVAEQPVEILDWLLRYADKSVAALLNHLGTLAWKNGSSSKLLLIFSEPDDFYHYLAHYSPPGEQSQTTGVCIHSGYTHIALTWSDELQVANTIVHELIHDAVSHLPIPAWLNEGLAQAFQRIIAPTPRTVGQGDQDAFFAAITNWTPPLVWDELAQKHFDFWNKENIQEFWAGTSFRRPGDPAQLSYNLAEILLKLITDQVSPQVFQAFIENARHEDAGQNAALEILDLDLGHLTATFLGEGAWRPNRKAIAHIQTSYKSPSD